MKKLLMLAVAGGVVVLVAKMIDEQKAEWQGLTESGVRSKLDAKLPDKIPAEKRDEIADKIVSGMRQKGVLAEDEVSEPTPDHVSDAGENAEAAAEDGSGENSESP